uniref:Small ribosomal subunit protein uS15m n=1 Tax=Acanthochromis polyacanthus TaxID=80966 RepID=A0A3Q1FU55_9TELE
MFTNIGLRAVLKSSAGVLRESSALCSAVTVKPWTCSSALLSGPIVSRGKTGKGKNKQINKNFKNVDNSHLSDLAPTMLKMDYAAVPLAQTTDDLVKRILSLELASHSDKLQIKKEQLIAKVQRDEHDRSSVEVQVAILTARIRNYQEHLLKHHKDKANKRRMLMSIDRRKKLLKNLRLVNYDAFEKVCEQLGITYTFPPEYYRRETRRWKAKKEFCIKVFKAVQKQKAEQRLKMKQSLASTETAATEAKMAETQ